MFSEKMKIGSLEADGSRSYSEGFLRIALSDSTFGRAGIWCNKKPFEVRLGMKGQKEQRLKCDYGG